jgi:hypothetical protein
MVPFCLLSFGSHASILTLRKVSETSHLKRSDQTRSVQITFLLETRHTRQPAQPPHLNINLLINRDVLICGCRPALGKPWRTGLLQTYRSSTRRNYASPLNYCMCRSLHQPWILILPDQFQFLYFHIKSNFLVETVKICYSFMNV